MAAKHPVESANDRRFLCLPQLLEHQSKRIPDGPAILAPGRAPLTYGRLYQHIEKMGRTLRTMGIGPRHRVAVILPNGPEMAVAILAVASGAVCAPMNQGYGAQELDKYFADLRPHALITQAGTDLPARRVALARGIRVIELSSERDQEAGIFTLTGEHEIASSDPPVSADDVALLLFTSGTTSRPKIVPLKHANVCISAYNSVAALALQEGDCGINMLPLYHGHGLNNNVLASLAAGASIVCTPGCELNSFLGWLTEFRPTWYSAVPPMHQAILGHVRRNRERSDYRLRFIRSASASLPPRVFTELEQTFETPVIETYGMTETASSYIACNPLPPCVRKRGSVGVPAGLDVGIMDERGALLPRGQTGEVIVRGPSVMAGYDGDQNATEAAFAGDWLKTGDLGFFDDDGYLFLVGRLREIINRGGEKIAPQEVDDVLLEHPAVAEAVTFAMPHATLGESVTSAVVLRTDSAATPRDLRRFVSGRIAHFKVPRQVVIVSEIPKGPTGKPQRIGLAAKLGLATSAASPRIFDPPRTPLEALLAERWAEILQVPQLGVHDDFFASGGDSLLAAEVLSHVYEVTRVLLPVSQFFEAPTVAEVAKHVEQTIHAGLATHHPLTIVPAPRKNGVMPASSAQERLWRLQHALPDLPFFNVLYALRVTSPCDVAVLERSVNEIVRRHEILRTTFAVIDGRHMQVIAPQLTVPLTFADLRPSSPSNQKSLGSQLIQEEMLHSFDLAKGPLIRTRLLRLGEQEHLFLISMHQVICDGWSLGVFVQELITLHDTFCAQGESRLAPLSYQYADFAHWQRQWKSHPEVLAQLAYWREQLREPLPLLQLAKPGRRGRSDDLRTARRRWTFSAGLADAAKRFSSREGGTLFMALVAGLLTLLHRYLDEDDVRVATNVANRNRPGADALIGPLVNTVVLRTHLGGDPTSQEVLRRVRATIIAAFDHQDLPYEELAETLERDYSTRPTSLAQVMILLQNDTLRPLERFEGTLRCEEVNPSMILPVVTTTSFDLILALVENNSGLVGTCIYKPHLFSAKEIDRLIQDFEIVIEQMVSQPERPISAICVFPNGRAGK